MNIYLISTFCSDKIQNIIIVFLATIAKYFLLLELAQIQSL